MSNLTSSTKSFQQQLGGVRSAISGAFAAVGIGTLIAKTIQLGSTLSDAAYQTGLSVELYQAFDAAARKAGGTGEQVRVMFNKLKLAQGDALSGGTQYARYFQQLGITMAELEKLSPEAVLERMAIAITNADNESQMFAATFKILGTRAGPALLEVLNEIANVGLQGIIDKGKETGEIMGEDVIMNLDRLADKWEVYKRKFAGLVGGGVTGIEALVRAFYELGRAPAAGWDAAWQTAAEKMGMVPESFPRKPRAPVGPSGQETAKERELRTADENLRRAYDEYMFSIMDGGGQIQLLEVRLDMLREEHKLTQENSKERINFYAEELRLAMKINQLKERQARADEAERKKQETQAESIRKAEDRLEQTRKGEGVTVQAIVADRLAAIGGYMGGQVSAEAAAANRQVQILVNIERALRRMPREIARHVESGYGE